LAKSSTFYGLFKAAKFSLNTANPQDIQGAPVYVDVRLIWRDNTVGRRKTMLVCILIALLLLIISLGWSTYVLMSRQEKTDEPADKTFEIDALIKSIPFAMLAAANLAVDIVSGDLFRGVDGNKKSQEDLFFWLKICYICFPITYPIGKLFLLRAKREGKKRVAQSTLSP